MEIKVLEKSFGCLPQVFKVGDWVDLTLAEDVKLKGPYAKMLKRKTKDKEVVERYRDVQFDFQIVPLGVCMELPKGYEALVVPRSSTFKKFGIIQVNSIGVIDNSYSSNEDEWKMPILAMGNIKIPKGTRIAQFRIQLSQKATWWQKVKWLFNSSISIKKVEHLNNKKRGGFGSTGN